LEGPDRGISDERTRAPKDLQTDRHVANRRLVALFLTSERKEREGYRRLEILRFFSR
jgi:hypothetical protein